MNLHLAKVFKVLAAQGLTRIPIEKGEAGDIVGIAGFERATVTNTLCDPEITKPVQVKFIHSFNLSKSNYKKIVDHSS